MIKYEKCQYPNCDGNYIPARSGSIKLCPKHFELMEFVLWMLENVKIPKEKVTKGGLILPK